MKHMYSVREGFKKMDKQDKSGKLSYINIKMEKFDFSKVFGLVSFYY